MMAGNYGRAGLASVVCVCLVLTGCSSNWINQAEEIVAVLIPAATNLVTLVSMLQGKNVSTGDLASIQNAGKEAGADLQLIQALLTAYEKADASARPGILSQIQSALGAAQGNLQGLLMGLHIKDAATQTKIAAVVGILIWEVQSLEALVPMVEVNQKANFPTLAAKSSARMRQAFVPRVPLSASEFVRSFNSTLTAKTGNFDLDGAAASLQIHLHSRVGRVASVGILK